MRALALVLLVACTGPAPAAPKPLPSAAPVPEDAGLRLTEVPAMCPEDAPWTGKACQGRGYVACPAGKRLDDAGTCIALDASH